MADGLTLEFQVIDWYVHDTLTWKGEQNEAARVKNGGTGRVDKKVNAEYGPSAEFTIEAFGLDHTGKTCSATITGFEPYFYIALPNELSASALYTFIKGLVPEFSGNSIRETPSYAAGLGPGIEVVMPSAATVKFKRNEETPYRISSHILPEYMRDDLVLEKCEQVQRFPFYGYQFNKTSPFLKLVFKNEAARKSAARALEKGILVEKGIFDQNQHPDCKFSTAPLHTFMQFKLFENNVDPLLRFLHERDINACGYITVPLCEVVANNKKMSSETYVICEWSDVNPLAEERKTAPIMMCSYDIEASSSHGDFPIADKGYEKLVTDILDYVFMHIFLPDSGWKMSAEEAKQQVTKLIKSAFSADEACNYISSIYTVKDEIPCDDAIHPVVDSMFAYLNKCVAKQIYNGDTVKVKLPGRKSIEKDEILNISSYEERFKTWSTKHNRLPNPKSRDKEEKLLGKWQRRMQLKYFDEAGLTVGMKNYRNSHLQTLPNWKWGDKPENDVRSECCSVEGCSKPLSHARLLEYHPTTRSWTARCERLHATPNYTPSSDEIAIYERTCELGKIEKLDSAASSCIPRHAYAPHYQLKKNGGERRWWEVIGPNVGDCIGIGIEPENGKLDDYTEMTKLERKRRRVALHAQISDLMNTHFPAVQGDRVIQIGSVFWRFGDDAPCRKHLLTLGTCDNVDGIEVECVDTERELLVRWSAVMREMSPQLLTGYNIFGFDAKFMWNRADALDCLAEFGFLSTYTDYETTIPHARHSSSPDEQLFAGDSKTCRCSTTGVLHSKLLSKELNSAGLGDNTLFYMDVPGMVQVDLLKLVMRDHNLSSYKLDDVTSNFINGKINRFEFRDDLTYLQTENTYGLSVGDFIRLYKVSIIGEEDIDEGKKCMIKAITLHEGYSEITANVAHISLVDDGSTYQWGLAKDDVTPNDIFRAWRKGGTAAQRAEIGKYCIQDSQLVMQLFLKLHVLGNNMGMSSVCSVPLQHIFTRGQGIKTFSLVSRECAKLNTVIPYLQQRPFLRLCSGNGAANLLMDALDKEATTVDKMREIDKFGSSSVTTVTDMGEETDTSVTEGSREGYQGAFVLAPKPAVYTDDAIAVVDYSSLYPSAIISENLCPSMHIRDPHYIGEVGAKRLSAQGIRFKDVSYDNYIYEAKGKGTSKRKNEAVPVTVCRFVQPVRQPDSTIRDEDRGILPRILRQVLDQRKATRKRMKGVTDPFLYNVLEGRQLAYKVTANSVYGSLGARTSQIYYKDIAASTTSTGRSLLMLAKDKIEEEFNGSEIVYGDTDSVFINFHPKAADGTPLKGKAALTKTIELGKLAGKHVTSFLEAPHDLEYEKTFWPFILFSKKRYVGNKYEMTDDKFKLSYMGIVLKRRDNAPIVKYMYADVIDTILNKQDVALSMERLRTNLTRLERGEFPLDYLVVSKSLRGHYDNPEQIVHKVLADRIAERDPGNKPQSNDRVPYVYVDIGARTVKLQGERVEHPDFIRTHKLNPDYAFYIEKQISKPISQIYALVLETMPGYKHTGDAGYWERKRIEYKNDRYGRDDDTISKKLDDDRMKEVNDLLFLEFSGKPKAKIMAAAAACKAMAAAVRAAERVAEAEKAISEMPGVKKGITSFFASDKSGTSKTEKQQTACGLSVGQKVQCRDSVRCEWSFGRVTRILSDKCICVDNEAYAAWESCAE
jgi:DNA polymerase elongation subunit (family B)